jgi:5-methylcytosine-specific restriction protein A
MNVEIIYNIDGILPTYYYDLKRINLNRSVASRKNNKQKDFKENYIENGELHENEECFEGSRKRIYVNKYERDPLLRKECILKQGAICVVCNTDFSKIYGNRGEGFIEVHHNIPLYKIGKEHKVKSTDLVPVCSNCHFYVA